ncbi:MAG: PQQ-binding-like beta-propeller repeat protein [Arachnia sp.]
MGRNPGQRRAERRTRPEGTSAVLICLGVVISLTLAGLPLAGPQAATPSTRAGEFLGEDGHFESFSGPDGVLLAETSRLTGGQLLATGPPMVSLAKDTVPASMEAAWVRVLTTSVSQTEVSHAMVLYELTPGGVTTAIDGPPGQERIYHPGRLEIPTDIAPGATWQGSGTIHYADGSASAQYTFSANADTPSDPAEAQAGCLIVVREEQVQEAVSSTSRLWCPGRGIISDERGFRGDDSPDLGPDPVTTEATLWQPDTWQLTDVTQPLVPPMVWAGAQPAVGSDDVAVIAHAVSGDLLFLPEDDPAAVWRVHPGGRITALERFGDLVVAATTQGRLVAYTLDGVRRWTADVNDLTVRRPVLWGNLLVSADLSAAVTARDITSGHVEWRVQVPDPIARDPVVCDGLTMVATTSAEVYAINDDGIAWSIEMTDSVHSLACAGESVVVFAGGTVDVISSLGQRLDSIAGQYSAPNATASLGEVVVIQTTTAVNGYVVEDGRLRRAWQQRGSFETMAGGDEFVVAASPKKLIALDAHGTLVGEWATDAFPAVTSPQIRTTPSGVVAIPESLRVVRLG